MNYRTFSNLQFTPLLKNSFHSIHLDLRNKSGKKIPFVPVGITQLVLSFRKSSNFHFNQRTIYKMVASRLVEVPYYRGIDRQRGRGFDALAQVIGRTVIPFLRKYIIVAAKRVVAHFLEFAASEIAEVVSGREFQERGQECGERNFERTVR